MGLDDFLGQPNAVSRLKAFGELYRTRGEVPEHVLITGAAGIGKLRLGKSFAETYSTALVDSVAESFERKGDLTAFLTSLQTGNAFVLRYIHQLRAPLVGLLRVALQEFRIDLVIENADKRRVFPYHLERFTCIATAPRLADVHSDLAKCFSLHVELNPYPHSELELITSQLAKESGLRLGDGVARMLADVSDGNPSATEQLLKRLSRLGKLDIAPEEAMKALAAFGLSAGPAARTASPSRIDDLNALSGIEFERLITGLLLKMGFRAEMTRSTGDGGIDVIAHLQTPLIGGRYLIQCKRFTNTLVGAPMIREFYGAVEADRKALKGIFITTSGFTDQAQEFAHNLPLELIDGVRLRHLLVENVSETQS